MPASYAAPGKATTHGAVARPAAAKPAASGAALTRAALPSADATGAGPLPLATGTLQPKLEVGPSGDRFEQEADRVASRVTATSAPAAAPPPAISALGGTAASRKQARRAEEKPVKLREQKQEKTADLDELTNALQRKPEKPLDPVEKPIEEEEVGQAKFEPGVIQRDDVDDDTIAETTVAQTKAVSGLAQRAIVPAEAELVEVAPPTPKEEEKPETPEPAQRDGPGGGFTAPASVEAGVGAMRGQGTPLSSDMRGYMEPRFGRDFSGVRLHTGSGAASASRAVGARAFTVGSDVFFGAGQYRPDTHGGRQLLAHELTHTIQQQGGSASAQPSRLQRAGAQQASNVTPPTPQ
ncbi:MAG: DUF4157 domain-containing protein, partial [Rhizobiales bacterium]|nr:DUF4157 domain-containing protein [Hyphomicrobiales bacterium]